MSIEAISALERGARTLPQRQTLALLTEALQLQSPELELLQQACRREPVPTQGRSRVAVAGPPYAMLRNRLTSFVGRTAEIEELHRLLEASRCVTLVGPGGIGKTRLAIEAVELIAPKLHLSPCFVALTPVANSDEVTAALRAALNVPDERRVRSADGLAVAIDAVPRLLILDNCEHVVDAVAEILLALLPASQNVRVVATSREPLRIEGETVYRVRSLDTATSDDNLAPSPAAALFLDRVGKAAPDLGISTESMAVAERIVSDLEGIPLAIELAAARADVLSLYEIADGVHDRLRFLSRGTRTAISHHRTLRETLDWSYERLTSTEALALSRLTVFAGGFTREAAEAVIADEALALGIVFDTVSRLCEVSMLNCERGTPSRYDMLQTIREYVREIAPPEDDVYRRHAAFFLDLPRGAESSLRTRDQSAWMERLKRDAENLSIALNFAEGREDFAELHLAAVAGLGRYWMLRGQFSEARRRYEASLCRTPTNYAELEVRACCSAALIALNEPEGRALRESGGEVPRAKEYAQRAVAVSSTVADEWTRLYAELVFANTRTWAIDPSLEDLLWALRARAQELSDLWLEEIAVWTLGVRAAARNELQAERLLREAVDIAYGCGDRIAIVTSAVALSRFLLRTDPALAAEYAAQAAAAIDTGNAAWLSACLLPAASAAVALRAAADAELLYRLWRTMSARSGRRSSDPAALLSGDDDRRFLSQLPTSADGISRFRGTDAEFDQAVNAIRKFADEQAKRLRPIGPHSH